MKKETTMQQLQDPFLQIDPERRYSLKAEAGILGSMMLDSKCIAPVLSLLPQSDCFAIPVHRIIYDAILRLYFKNVPIDAVTLMDELETRGKLEEVGGVEYIAEILQSVPHAENAKYYATKVKEKKRYRDVINAVRDMGTALSEPGPIDELVGQVQDIALELELNTKADYVELKDVVTKIATDMQDNKGEVVQTSFVDLDRLIQGFYPGEFVILAGRPSMGKTALALDMSLSIAKAGTSVFFASLEMPERTLIERALCGRACVDMAQVRSGQADEEDMKEIYRQAFELRETVNLIISNLTYTPAQVAGMIRRLKQTHNIGIAFVDYLQLMTSGRKSENRQQEITTISRQLKAIAMRESIPLVALSQLNRQVDAREDHRPRMSDLRESGSLEQDADLVLLVYRDDYYRNSDPGFEPTGKAEVIVAKARNGPTGKADLVFVQEQAKFSNLARD